MVSGSISQDLAGGTAAFEVERFEWAADDRLEVEGCWFGIRGRRFMRPTLTLHAADDRRRVLALLEHKPWAVEVGLQWTAAFPWQGEHVAFEHAELTVAPGVNVALPPPRERGAPKKRRSRAKAGAPPAAPARAREAPGESADDEAALGRLRLEFDGVRDQAAAATRLAEREAALRKRVAAERDAAVAERDALREAHAAATSSIEALKRELADAVETRDTQLREGEKLRDQLARAETERRAALSAKEGFERRSAARFRAELEATRTQLERERDEATAARDEAIAEQKKLYDTTHRAVTERDAARRERNDLLSRLDTSLTMQGTLARAREAANQEIELLTRERDELRAERDAVASELSAAVEASESAGSERRRLVAERDAAVAERTAADRERDSAIIERDSAIRERDAAIRSRKAALGERDSAVRELDQLRADADTAEFELGRGSPDPPA